MGQSYGYYKEQINEHCVSVRRISYIDECYGRNWNNDEGISLEESLETVYGENAVQHMMSGKAVSRAPRGHFLVEAALTNKLISNYLPQKLKKMSLPKMWK